MIRSVRRYYFIVVVFNRYKLHLPRSVSNSSLIGNPQCFDVLKDELLDDKLEDHHGRLESVVIHCGDSSAK